MNVSQDQAEQYWWKFSRSWPGPRSPSRLALPVTALIYALLPWFWLWMAVCGGGALLGTGLYIRLRWR